MSKIDFTDNYDDLVFVVKLARLLKKINLPSSKNLEENAWDLHNDIFCSDCEWDRGSCECHSGSGRYAQEYDDGIDFEN